MDGFSIMKPAKNTLVLQVWLLCRVIFSYSATLRHNFSYISFVSSLSVGEERAWYPFSHALKFSEILGNRKL